MISHRKESDRDARYRDSEVEDLHDTATTIGAKIREGEKEESAVSLR